MIGLNSLRGRLAGYLEVLTVEAPLRLAELRLVLARATHDDSSVLGQVGLCADLHEVMAGCLRGGAWLGARMYRREVADAEARARVAPPAARTRARKGNRGEAHPPKQRRLG